MPGMVNFEEVNLYCARAKVLLGVVEKIIEKVELAKACDSYADRYNVVVQATKAINTILYSFLIDRVLYDSLDERLNNHVKEANSEDDIDVVMIKVSEVLKELQDNLIKKVEQYCDEKTNG